jgi:hypothetical protein
MFTSWTEELQMECSLSTHVKMPQVHLDREVKKDPRFIKDLDIKMREKFNELYNYSIQGRLSEI